MFGLGRRKDEDVRRMQAREDELSQQLEQAQNAILEANARAEKAESHAAFLASQNRALAAKVHRLALQRVELQNEHDRVVREHKDLQVTNLQLEGEAQMARAAKADAWQVLNLQTALRQQAAQHENKMASLKRRTKALLTAMLPGGHGQAGVGLLSPGDQSAPGSPGSDSGTPDLWDAPLTPPRQVEYNQPDVHMRVRQVIEYLYDDTLSEDQALEQMTAITREILDKQAPLPPTDGLLSRGCSPFPVPKLAATEAASAAEKVDAATDMLSHRAHFVSDVATETPAEMSCIGTPRDVSATPSLAPGSPSSRLGGGRGQGVPALDLAALVAQAMEDAPLSARSTASTSAGGAGPSSFNAFSQFVLAQPEKLQRLIMRHAAATGALAGASRQPQSPYGAAAAAASVTAVPHRTAVGPTSLDPMSLSGARPSLASRLLGLGGGLNSNATSSNVSNGPPPTNSSADGFLAAGILKPSSAGNKMASPAKLPASKPIKVSAAPKLVTLDGSAPAPAAHRGTEGPTMVQFPGAKLLAGLENSGGAASGGGGSSGSGGMGFGSFGKMGKVDLLENDLQELSLGSNNALAAFRR